MRHSGVVSNFFRISENQRGVTRSAKPASSEKITDAEEMAGEEFAEANSGHFRARRNFFRGRELSEA